MSRGHAGITKTCVFSHVQPSHVHLIHSLFDVFFARTPGTCFFRHVLQHGSLFPFLLSSSFRSIYVLSGIVGVRNHPSSTYFSKVIHLYFWACLSPSIKGTDIQAFLTTNSTSPTTYYSSLSKIVWPPQPAQMSKQKKTIPTGRYIPLVAEARAHTAIAISPDNP